MRTLSLIDGTQTIEKRFGGRYIGAEFETFYNAGPSMYLPIVRTSSDGREIVLARWGLEMPSAPGFKPQANARLDTAGERKMFKHAFQTQHCLIPANSFFEWRREKGIKQPYRIYLKDQPLFAMAGIWEPGLPGHPPTFTVLTTDANAMMQAIHDRMPVILKPEAEEEWLHESGEEAMRHIPDQYPSDDMGLYPVTTRINKVSYQMPDAIEPVREPSLGI